MRPKIFFGLQMTRYIYKTITFSANDATLMLLLPFSGSESLDTEFKTVVLHKWSV
jgi:hypothetical protein